MQDSKILITNFPRLIESFSMASNDNEKWDVVYGYDFKMDQQKISLNIARDLTTALLTFDKIFIEADHIWDIIQVCGHEYVKELLRLNVLCIIPDQELNPVLIRERNGNWKHDFISYVVGSGDNFSTQNIHKWSHVEHQLRKHGLDGIEANAILYLIDENSADIGNVKDLQNRINQETERDIVSPSFLSDSNFYRRRPDGKWEYNQVSRNRLQELNKSAVLSAVLGIDNVKTDAEISNIMQKKVASEFSVPLHEGNDVLIRIEQQKGFPDLGELFVEKIINLDDLLKLRDSMSMWKWKKIQALPWSGLRLDLIDVNEILFIYRNIDNMIMKGELT